MYIKTKKVQLKKGRIQRYYYIAMSIRLDKNHVRPEIIRYIGKTVPMEVREWLRNKNQWLKEKKELRRKSNLTPLMMKYEQETGKHAFWHGRVTKQFLKWKVRQC